MVDDHQDAVPNSNHGFLLASPGSQTVILSRQVGVLGMGRSMGGFHQQLAQPGVALARLAREPFASTLVVAWTHACPRCQMPIEMGKRDMSSPISARIPSAARQLMPGMVQSKTMACSQVSAGLEEEWSQCCSQRACLSVCSCATGATSCMWMAIS